MRRFMYGVLCATAVILIQGRPAQAETAKEIVQKAIDAHGGLDALKKYPGGKMSFKGKMSIMGLEVTLDGETLYLLPDQFKNTMKMDVLGQKVAVEQIVNGGKIKMTANGMTPPLSDALKEEIKSSKTSMDVYELYPLLNDKVYTLSVVEKADKVNDKEMVGILVKAKDLKDTTLFFDAKTFVLTKVERKGLDFTEKEVKQEMIMLDHKKYDGILRYSKFEMLFDGNKTMTVDVTDYKHLDKVDKKEFDIAD